MIKLKNKICQERLEVVSPGKEKAETEQNNNGSGGWSCFLTGDGVQGAAVIRGWQ